MSDNMDPDADDIARSLKLLAHCRAFIIKQDITCEETVYQTDRVIENAYEFIHEMCEIVGYVPSEDDE